MSHYKNESGRKLPKALCRFFKILPTGLHVTFGSGCIVLQSGPPPSADLITTTQVLSKNDLLGDSSIFVQFEDNQWFELKLKSQDAVNLPDSKSGRVLGHIEGNEDQVSFLRIPVDMFDSRMWPIRKIWPLKRRALSCFYPSDENLETSISNKNITCYVISEDRKDRGFYITEPSYLRFGTDTHEFALLSISDTDCASPAKTFKDFAKEEKPKGAPLLDAEGRLVGMLAVAKFGERKVYPVFLPTLTGDSNSDGPRDEKNSNTDTMPFQNTIFRPGPDKKEQHNNHSPINPPSKDFRNEDKGAQTSTTDRQGSASPPSGPLREGSSEVNFGNGSAQDQYKEQQQNEYGGSHRPENGEETSSGEVEGSSSAEMANQNQPHDDPSTSSLPEDNSAPKQRKDQEQDESVTSQRPKTGEETSSEKVENSSSVEVENNGKQQIDPRSSILQDDDEKSSPEERENSSINSALEEDFASSLEEKDQEGGNAGHGDANFEVSLRDEPDGKSREKHPQVDNYTNEDVAQNSTSQARVPILATQNSYHDQISDPNCLHDEEDFPFPTTVTDPTPFEHKPTLQERHSNSQHGMGRTATMQTGEVSTEKEHVKADFPFPTTVTDPTPFEHKPTLRERHSNSQHVMDRTATMQTGEVSAEEEHVNADSKVEEFILGKELIMDILSLYLDRSIYPKFRSAPSLAKRWEHLADYCKVDAKIKEQCGISAHQSPSEAMFKHLCQPWESVTVGTLKKNLLDISRKDVYDELAKAKDLLDNHSMNDLSNNHPGTLWNICLRLDDNRSVRYWYHLGLKIGISGEILRSFKGPSEPSPSKAILEKIETLNPDLSLKEVQKVLREVEKWLPGICNVLKKIAADSSSTIQTLLDDLDAVEKLTTLLDLEEKAWVLFGSKLGMKRQELNSLREESPPSPTKLLMKHIVAREPELTMKFFLGALANIKRFDVIKELKKFFVAKDIDDLLKG